MFVPLGVVICKYLEKIFVFHGKRNLIRRRFPRFLDKSVYKYYFDISPIISTINCTIISDMYILLNKRRALTLTTVLNSDIIMSVKEGGII